jgi:hypothetical protein
VREIHRKKENVSEIATWREITVMERKKTDIERYENRRK